MAATGRRHADLVRSVTYDLATNVAPKFTGWLCAMSNYTVNALKKNYSCVYHNLIVMKSNYPISVFLSLYIDFYLRFSFFVY